MNPKIKGLCEGHEDPDLWFPELPIGTPTLTKILALSERMKKAIAICDICPFKAECKEEGMKEENLPNGIFGGMMAGERLVEAGVMLQDVNSRGLEARAFHLMTRMTPLVRWE